MRRCCISTFSHDASGKHCLSKANVRIALNFESTRLAIKILMWRFLLPKQTSGEPNALFWCYCFATCRMRTVPSMVVTSNSMIDWLIDWFIHWFIDRSIDHWLIKCLAVEKPRVFYVRHDDDILQCSHCVSSPINKLFALLNFLTPCKTFEWNS